jgi:hypothetical protein
VINRVQSEDAHVALSDALNNMKRQLIEIVHLHSGHEKRRHSVKHRED